MPPTPAALTRELPELPTPGRVVEVRGSLAPERRIVVKNLLVEAGLTDADAIGVLRAVEGVHQQIRSVEPVWTVPGAKAGSAMVAKQLFDLQTALYERVHHPGGTHA